MFFCGKLPKPVAMPELFNWSASKAGKYLQQKPLETPTILTKEPPVATTFPSGIKR